MSVTILNFAKSFVMERLSADAFSDGYMELWKIERDMGILKFDGASLSECLSSIFCVADMYNSDPAREDYEFDGEGLRRAVTNLMEKLEKSNPGNSK